MFTLESVDVLGEFSRFFFLLSTLISHRWQFAGTFQGVSAPLHFFVKNTTVRGFFTINVIRRESDSRISVADEGMDSRLCLPHNVVTMEASAIGLPH